MPHPQPADDVPDAFSLLEELLADPTDRVTGSDNGQAVLSLLAEIADADDTSVAGRLRG